MLTGVNRQAYPPTRPLWFHCLLCVAGRPTRPKSLWITLQLLVHGPCPTSGPPSAAAPLWASCAVYSLSSTAPSQRRKEIQCVRSVHVHGFWKFMQRRQMTIPQRVPSTDLNDDSGNDDKQASASALPDDAVKIIVPSHPPDFGPTAVRALLRLLVAVHRKRINSDQPPGET